MYNLIEAASGGSSVRLVESAEGSTAMGNVIQLKSGRCLLPHPARRLRRNPSGSPFGGLVQRRSHYAHRDRRCAESGKSAPWGKENQQPIGGVNLSGRTRGSRVRQRC
jgi:hypothetical protein